MAIDERRPPSALTEFAKNIKEMEELSIAKSVVEENSFEAAKANARAENARKMRSRVAEHQAKVKRQRSMKLSRVGGVSKVGAPFSGRARQRLRRYDS